MWDLLLLLWENGTEDCHFSSCIHLFNHLGAFLPSSGGWGLLDIYELLRDSISIIYSESFFFIHHLRFTRHNPCFPLLNCASIPNFLSCLPSSRLLIRRLPFLCPRFSQVDEPAGARCYWLHTGWQGATPWWRWNWNSLCVVRAASQFHLPVTDMFVRSRLLPSQKLDYWSESDQDEVDGSMTLKQEGPSSLCDTYHRTPSVSTHRHTHAHWTFSFKCSNLTEYFISKSPIVFSAA